MAQNVNKVGNLHDRVAPDYTMAFSGERQKKPKGREILQRFFQERGGRSGISVVVPVKPHTT